MAPKMRLSDQTVRALPHPENGQRDYADDAVAGLCVRVGTRAKTFVLITRSGKNRKRHTIGRYDPPRFTLAMAREKAGDIIARERLAKSDGPQTTFEDAVEVYYRVHLPKLRPSSQRNIKRYLDRHYRPKLGKRILGELKRSDIAPLLDEMLDTPAAMHNGFKHLASFLNWCAARGYMEDVPTDRMPTPPRSPSRTRVLSAGEIVAVWNGAPDSDYGRILKLCLLSGQRKHQWAEVRREYIAADVVTWPAAVMKSAKVHALPLTPLMKSLLPNDRIGYLFPNGSGTPFDNWTRNKDRLDAATGIVDFRLHDLRRTWATISAEELDTPPHIIESVLA